MSDEIQPLLGCTIALLYATDNERDAIRKFIAPFQAQWTTHRLNKPGLALSKYYYIGRIGDETLCAIRTDVGALGARGSSAISISLRQIKSSIKIIQIGTAFGISTTTQRIGDVLISSHIFPYDKKAIQDKEDNFTYNYDKTTHHESNKTLLHILSNYSKKTTTQQSHTGVILSGNSHIYSKKYLTYLRDLIPPIGADIVGGEMEGFGLIDDSKESSWIIVKGISDFADQNLRSLNTHDNQQVTQNRKNAAENAVEFLFNAFKNSSTHIGAQDDR